MQLSKKTKKRFLPLFMDSEGTVKNFFKNGKTVSFASLNTTNKYLDACGKDIKGYHETLIVEKVVMIGFPKGKYKLIEKK